MYMYSNTSYCYCKISGFKTIAVAQYTWSELAVFLVYNVVIVYGVYMLARTLVVYSICSLQTYIYLV